MSETMLYKRGATIKCGPFSLDYIIVGDGDIQGKLAEGWVKTPAETDEQKKKPGPKPKVAQDGANKG